MQSDTAKLVCRRQYLRAEVAASHVFGPVDPGMLTVQVSPFGLVPENDQLRRWRLTVDLSLPRLASVNKGIATDLCSLSMFVSMKLRGFFAVKCWSADG